MAWVRHAGETRRGRMNLGGRVETWGSAIAWARYARETLHSRSHLEIPLLTMITENVKHQLFLFIENSKLFKFLLFNKYYTKEIYASICLRRLVKTGRLGHILIRRTKQ